MKRCSAFTFVELIAVMAGASAVMGISIIMFFVMFDFEQKYQEQSAQIRSTNRLIEQFRKDAAAYPAPEIAPENDVLLQWSAGDEKIVYTLVPGDFPEKKDVVRRVFRNDEIISTEIYHLPDDSVLWFVLGKDENDSLIALSLWETRLVAPAPDPGQLDPFHCIVPESLEREIDPKYAGNWRTAVVRIHVAL